MVMVVAVVPKVSVGSVVRRVRDGAATRGAVGGSGPVRVDLPALSHHALVGAELAVPAPLAVPRHYVAAARSPTLLGQLVNTAHDFGGGGRG